MCPRFYNTIAIEFLFPKTKVTHCPMTIVLFLVNSSSFVHLTSIFYFLCLWKNYDCFQIVYIVRKQKDMNYYSKCKLVLLRAEWLCSQISLCICYRNNCLSLPQFIWFTFSRYILRQDSQQTIQVKLSRTTLILIK